MILSLKHTDADIFRIENGDGYAVARVVWQESIGDYIIDFRQSVPSRMLSVITEMINAADADAVAEREMNRNAWEGRR